MKFRREYTQVIRADDGHTQMWQRCVIPGCRNLICQGVTDVLCYPHGIHYGIFTAEEFEADRRRKCGG